MMMIGRMLSRAAMMRRNLKRRRRKRMLRATGMPLAEKKRKRSLSRLPPLRPLLLRPLLPRLLPLQRHLPKHPPRRLRANPKTTLRMILRTVLRTVLRTILRTTRMIPIILIAMTLRRNLPLPSVLLFKRKKKLLHVVSNAKRMPWPIVPRMIYVLLFVVFLVT
jgi:hypothetical protein